MEPFLPTGSNPAANWFQKAHEKLFGPSGKIRNSSTVSVDHTSKGIFLTVKEGKGGSPTISASGSQRYMLVSTFSDYWVCKDLIVGQGYLWPIARPDYMRCSIASLGLEGVTTTYVYTGFTSPTNYQWLRRQVTHGSDDPVIEGITPIPLFNSSVPSPAYAASYIYADSPISGTGAVIASGDTTLYGPTATALTAGTAVTLMDRGNWAWSVLVTQTGEGS